MVLLLVAGAAEASANFPGQLPNGTKNSCNTCHGTSAAAGNYNAFGQALSAFSGQGVAQRWTQVYDKDSDGDGVTNGAELGDPCGVWVQGSPPVRATDITNPGVKDATADPELECDDPGGGSSGGGNPTGGATPPPSTAAGLAEEQPDVPQNACAVGAAAGRDAGASWTWVIAGALALLGARRRR